MKFFFRHVAAVVLSCPWLPDAQAMAPSELQWDLSYASVLTTSAVGPDEFLRFWVAEHPMRPMQERLATYAGEPIEATVLLERPDSHAGDPQALWIVKTHGAAQACSYHPKIADEPCKALPPDRVEAFARQVMALQADAQGISPNNIVDANGPGGRPLLMNWYAFVSVRVDGHSLQRAVPLSELLPHSVPGDPAAGQLQAAIDQLLLTPSQLKERNDKTTAADRFAAEQRAAEAGDVNTLARLLSEAPLSPPDSSALLEVAAVHRQLPIIALLQHSGADIDVDESRALRAAVETGDLELVRGMLALGAKVDPPPPSNSHRRNPLYESPLATAARTRQHAIARLLIARGADVNLPQMSTVLGKAARSHDLTMLDIVLAAGALPDGIDRLEGYTALMALAQDPDAPSHAAEATNEQVVRRLIAAGADVNFASNVCVTAYDLAVDWHRDAMTALLLRVGAEPQRRATCMAQRSGTALQKR